VLTPSGPLLAPQLVLECCPAAPCPTSSCTALPMPPAKGSTSAEHWVGGRKPATRPTAPHTARSFPAAAKGPPSGGVLPWRPCSTSLRLEAPLARKWLPVKRCEALPCLRARPPCCCCCSVVLRACTAAFMVSRIWSSCWAYTGGGADRGGGTGFRGHQIWHTGWPTCAAH
jgi:hypothetical protein